jgi:hypothetical protein
MVLTALECRVEVDPGSLTCQPASMPETPARFDVIVGGQHHFVRLTSTGISTSGDVLSASVTVQNLLLEPMGTTDGVNPAGAGVRVFFHSDPTNGVTVANPDGFGTFTGTNQAFYQYSGHVGDGILERGETFAAKKESELLVGELTDFLDQHRPIQCHDLRDIGHRSPRKASDLCTENHVTWGIAPLEAARQRNADDSGDAASVESVPLNDDDGPTKAGSGADGLADVGPPDLTLCNYQSARYITRRAALATKASGWVSSFSARLSSAWVT